MKTPKKKMRPNDYLYDDILRKPIKKTNKRDRKISIYDAEDEEDEFAEEFDDVFDEYDLDSYEEIEEDEDY